MRVGGAANRWHGADGFPEEFDALIQVRVIFRALTAARVTAAPGRLARQLSDQGRQLFHGQREALTARTLARADLVSEQASEVQSGPGMKRAPWRRGVPGGAKRLDRVFDVASRDQRRAKAVEDKRTPR